MSVGAHLVENKWLEDTCFGKQPHVKLQSFVGFLESQTITLPETNSEVTHENELLEDDIFLLGQRAYFQRQECM